MPKVSVILPTYNRAGVLGRAVKSVLDQTYLDFELIVVDDGSSDNTEEVVNSFNDPRIRLLRHERNKGVSAARNTGIQAASGEYIAFQDSDDEWLPEKLEKQMALFARDKTGRLGLVICGATFGNSSGQWQVKPQPNLLNREGFLYREGGHGIGTIMLLVKRALAGAEMYFDTSLPASVDWDFLVRVSQIVNIEAVPEPLVKAHRIEGPHVWSVQNVINARIAILQKYAREYAARPKTLGRQHEWIAFHYHRLADIQHARSHLKAAIAAYPGRPATYLYFVASLFGLRGLNSFIKTLDTSKTVIRRIKSRFGLARKKVESSSEINA